MTKGSSLILRIYFALVSLITLITLMFGAIDFLSLGLKTYVFTAADVPTYGLTNCDDLNAARNVAPPKYDSEGRPVELTDEEVKARCEAQNATRLKEYQAEKANNAVRNLALIIISFPLFLVHFRIVFRDWKAERGEK
jgi:hypothetical protein